MKSFKVLSLTILFVVSLLKNSVPDLTKRSLISPMNYKDNTGIDFV